MIRVIALTILFFLLAFNIAAQMPSGCQEQLKLPLPVYRSDLFLNQFSAGSLTSQAALKRWNRKNEALARAAEPAAVMADWLCGIKYPTPQLNKGWWLVLGNQIPSVFSGTCPPKSYECAWNDEIIAMNQFAAVLQSSSAIVIRGLDTRGEGRSLVVYNPLSVGRKDLVEAELYYPEGIPQHLRLVDAENKEIPLQIKILDKTNIRILFVADLPSLGFSCFDVQSIEKESRYTSDLSAGSNYLENEFLKVTLNSKGDIASIFDKKLGKEMLSGVTRLEFLKEHPQFLPAANMDWNDRKKPPIEIVQGPAQITLIEKGPVRILLKVERSARNSTFIQNLQLISGKPGLTVQNTILWQSRGVSLKTAFPFTASNPVATYNFASGAEERSGNNEKQFEFPSRQWIDLTDKSGTFGISVLEDCKYASDKPNDKTLRLTLLYTPTSNVLHDEATQDWGIHNITYSIYPHKGDWRTGLTEWQASSLNQPPVVFEAPQHPGFLGKKFSFVQISSPVVDIRSLKKAENGNSIILRLQEFTGKDIPNVEVSLAAKIKNCWEVDEQEIRTGDALINNGKLIVDFKKYETHSFALQLEAPVEKLTEPFSLEIPIPMDQDVVSDEKKRKNESFGSEHISIPAELFPDRLSIDGITFKLGNKTEGQKNVLTCSGQKIQLPKTGNFNHVYILAAAYTDTNGLFKVGNIKSTLHIQSLTGKIGQFDNRAWDKYGRLKGLEKGFIKRDEIAWFSDHAHRDSINLPNQRVYIFKYALEAGPASGTLQLPENEAIKIFAITVADHPSDQIHPVAPLYDDFSHRPSMSLTLPASYVDENLKPTAQLKFCANKDLSALPGRVTMRDYADIHQPNGVVVKYFATGADSTLNIGNDGIPVPAINDGMYDLMPQDSIQEKWSESGEGRIWMDLQKEIELDSIHIFTAQDLRRGSQSFSLWGATGKQSPPVKGDPRKTGWKFLLLATPQDAWNNGKALYTIIPGKENPRQYRYLLWISEDTPHGPYYFREIDIFEKQN
ncbi:MAG: glycoside hydrolase family 38 C-terminal domain-containing protein [Bacteroidales bacterium]|nr:glycoside hydrolase family 38 C-terminal domain-containing protein [Bacteroidales bacterium]